MHIHAYIHTYVTVIITYAKYFIVQPSQHIPFEHVLSLWVERCRGLSPCQVVPGQSAAGQTSEWVSYAVMVGGVGSDLEQKRRTHFPSGTLERRHEKVTFELICDEGTGISRSAKVYPVQ